MGVKISELTSMGALAGAEKIAGVDSGTQYTTPADLKTYISPKYARLADVKAANTSGGTATAATWTKRALAEITDADGICSVSADAFTIGSGTYRIRARSPYFQVSRFTTRLRNTSDGTTVIDGSSGFSIGNAVSHSFIEGEFTIAASKTFEVQYYIQASSGTQDLGVEANAGVSEVYTVVELWKVA